MRAALSGDRAVDVIDDVTRLILEGAAITPSIEQTVQGALDVLRREGDAENIRRAERISTTLFTLVQAKRNGRPNLYASQLLRLAAI